MNLVVCPCSHEENEGHEAKHGTARIFGCQDFTTASTPIELHNRYVLQQYRLEQLPICCGQTVPTLDEAAAAGTSNFTRGVWENPPPVSLIL